MRQHKRIRGAPEGYTITEIGLRCAASLHVRIEAPPDPEQVQIARLYLRLFWRPSVMAKQYSYALKHLAERWSDKQKIPGPTYVSNGALILAAVELGARVSPEMPGRDSLNGVVWVVEPRPHNPARWAWDAD